MKHRRQHYIPVSYLKAWCDTNCPTNYEPYVWLYDLVYKKWMKKSPSNVFFEHDFYTQIDSDDNRILDTEFALSRLESIFTRLRNNKLNKNLPISSKDHFYLCMFIASMHIRTKKTADKFSNLWKNVLEISYEMTQFLQPSSPEDSISTSNNQPPILPPENKYLTIADAQYLYQHPLDGALDVEVIKQVSLEIFKMPFIIFTSLEENSFITSDAPSVFFDIAKGHRRFAGGLVSPTIEISFPISPKQVFYASRLLVFSGIYMPISVLDRAILNYRTRINAKKYLIEQKEVFSEDRELSAPDKS